MTTRRWLTAIWICFLVRALFYCAALPVWEGYDEWSHFAVVQRMAFGGEVLVARDSPVPRDVADSLVLAPVSWECRKLEFPSLPYDEFWKLPAAERTRREAAFHAIPAAWSRQDTTRGWQTYEGLHGPISYWLMVPVLWAAGGAHLSTQVLLLRWFNMAILSLMIPFAYGAARAVFRRDGVALGCAALLAVMPGLLIGIARVSNESVAVTLFSALIWLSVSELTPRRVMAIGVVLGLGLLTKAYFLAALPVAAVVLAWRCRRTWVLWAPGLVVAIAGWWYVRNLLTTGTLSGMWESALRPTEGVPLASVAWLRTADSILFSHLWLGAWSTLTVRSWMYHALYALMAAAAVGLVYHVGHATLMKDRAPIRAATVRERPAGCKGRTQTARTFLVGRPILAAARFQRAIRAQLRLLILAAYYAVFWAGQLWHAALLQTVWGIATSLGVYLNAVGVAEAILCVAGIRALTPAALRTFVAPAGVALMALFDFYTLHMVALPYYAGFTAHRPGGGAVTSFHPAGVSLADFIARLATFKSVLLPEAVLIAMWFAYAIATFALVAISLRVAREN